MSKFFVLTHTKKVVPVDPFEWSDTYDRDTKGRQVGRTIIKGCVISTMFLGIGCMHGLKPTVMFETTVYRDDIKCDEFTSQHDTWDEAELGHLLVIDKVRAHFEPVLELAVG